MNQVANDVIEARRGIHPEFVFTYRSQPGKKKPLSERGPGKPVGGMNNNA
jgi:hypothetical protein